MVRLISILLILAPSLYFGYTENAAAMLLALVAGTICAAILNIDRLDSFKIWKVFEAKTKEAQDVIDEANATIEQLKNTSLPMMDYLLAHVIRGDNITGIAAREKEELLDRLIINYEQFEIANISIQRNIEEAKMAVLYKYFSEIATHYVSLEIPFETDNTNDVYHELHDFFKKEIRTKEEITRFLDEKEVLDDVVKLKIDNYENFRLKHNFK